MRKIDEVGWVFIGAFSLVVLVCAIRVLMALYIKAGV